MSCGCTKVSKTSLWTPVPDYRQPTEIQPGENIDCYAARAGSVSGLKNDTGAKPNNLIDNTSLATDLTATVNTTFILTPGSTRTPTSWTININGVAGTAPLTELTWDGTVGKLSGQVLPANQGKNYTVLITALDASGQIDSRSYNFFPKTSSKDDTIKFVIPLDGNVHVTCGYGPRTAPVFGASTFHHGYDFARVDHSRGNILAAADGTVVKTGPATGFGNWIMIEHHDSQERLVATTVYGHMNNGNTFVSVGDKVAAGQKIALEGNAGLGTAMHLHFEIHKGKWRNSVDPGPYLNGAVAVANNNDGSGVLGPDGTAAPTDGTTTSVSNNAGMTSAESANANANCPVVLPNDSALPPKTSANETTPAAPTNNSVPNTAPCSPPSGQIPSSTDTLAKINQALNEDPSLTPADKSYIITVATIESNLNPYAKNPTSSATGLYQFLDSLAAHYYPIIGEPVTCATRCDPYLATKAMIAFYKDEMLPYWNGFVASGRTAIANKPIQPTAWSAQYGSFSQGDFMYGIVQHDGVGNGVRGIDKGGVAYWRSKVGTA